MPILKWEMKHPKMSMEQLGLIPYWFHEGDERTSQQIINDNYGHGGGFRAIQGFKLNPDHSIKYPGDPILKPLAMARRGDELLVFYDCAILAIIQPDHSFVVTRVD